MARTHRELFEWQVLEEEGEVPLDGLEWEEDLAVAEVEGRPIPQEQIRPRRNWRPLVAVVAVFFVLGAAFLWWRTRMTTELVRRDVQQVVSQESLAWEAGDADQFAAVLDSEASRGWRSRELRRFHWLQAWWPDSIFNQPAEVESVTLRGDRAEAQVLYRPARGADAYRTTRFFRRLSTEDGWRRTAPDPDLWGATREATTEHFHFIYRERDAAAVEAILPEVDEFYGRLQQAARELEAGRLSEIAFDLEAGERITVTVEPRTDIVDWRITNGSLSLVSPELQLVPAGATADAELRRALAQPLARALLEDLSWDSRLPREGHNFAHGVSDWLADHWSGTEPWSVGTQAAALRAAREEGAPLGVEAFSRWSRDEYGRLWHAHSYFLASYVAATYGEEAFLPLLRAWQTQTSWNEVLPAALGATLPEFEAGWERYVADLTADEFAGG